MRQISVMIVEDEGLIANDIAHQLRSSGYAVDGIAASGEDALAHLDRSRPDLVLMDIRLQGELDGIDTAMRVRAQHRLPVIIVTSHADSETLARAKYAEPLGYLVKPFRQVNLCSAIEMAVYKHRSEIALMNRESWLSTILQTTADPTIVLNTGGLIDFMNPSAEKLLQSDLAQASGLSWATLMPLCTQGGHPMNQQLLAEASGHSKVLLPRGAILRRRDGVELAVEGELCATTSNGILDHVVVTIRDVSLRNEQQARLQHEQKMLALGRLAGGVAHDFNNLLTGIIGHVSLMANEQNPSELRGRIASVMDAAQTAVLITNQLLTLSGNLVLDNEVLNVTDRIYRLIWFVGPSLGSTILRVVDLSSSTGRIRMNAAQFDQIVLNLMINARDAMPEGGTLTIATSNMETGVMEGDLPVTKRYVRILIRDSRERLSAEAKERIFEPFFNSGSDGRGSGLGLSIVYGIVRDAGGQITVESAPGGGASFEVLIPLVNETEDNATGKDCSALSGTPPRKTILLAEDDIIVRELVLHYLKDQGFHLIVAESGEEALDAARKYAGRIHLLLSDVRMPKMDGVTLSQQINASRPETKTLLMSGYTGDSTRFSQQARSMFGFIQKPFMPPDLLEKIHELTA